jgi:hypothetical protein
MHVVLEGQTLMVELEAPGMDIVGFEHAPHDQADRDAIRKAIAALEDAGAKLTPSAAAGCVLAHAHAELESLSEAEGAKSGHKDHGHKDHADKDHGHKDHEHKHAEASAEESHSAFHAQYKWRCSSPDKLGALAVGHFELFKTMEEIEALIISPKGQTAQTLTPKSSEIRF